MKLRLLLFEECNRDCKGCCNKDWDLPSLSKETDFKKYNQILLTGGEPMLMPFLVISTINRIRKESTAKIFIYTAKVDILSDIFAVLQLADGITVTLHEQIDVDPFLRFNNAIVAKKDINKKSLRCNIFKNVTINKNALPLWKIKSDIEWIKNCPLPINEVLKRV